MDQRRSQLRLAKQRQRIRDREAGLMIYQSKLPVHLAQRLKAGLKNPAFRARFSEFLETELIEVADYPQLRFLCWNLKTRFLTRADAHALYERNWRLIEWNELEPDERALIEALIAELGNGVVNA